MFDLPIYFDLVARGFLLTSTALLWVLLLVRIVGLRAFSKMTAFDFVATVAMGSLLATGAAADDWSSFAQVIIAMVALLGVQAGLAWLRKRSYRVRELLGNTPVLLMRDGEFCDVALRQTRVAREDVMAKIRSANVLDLKAIRAVVLENTGDISVLHGGELHEEVIRGVADPRSNASDHLSRT